MGALLRGKAYLQGLSSWKVRLGVCALLSPAILLAALLLAAEPASLTVAALLINYMLLPAGLLVTAAILSLLLAHWPLARALTLLAAGASAAVASASILSIHPPIDWPGTMIAILALVTSGILLAVATSRFIVAYELKPAHVVALGAALLALLPLVQFWHVASFVPAQQETTLGVVVTTNAVPTKQAAHGEITVTITNSGAVGALVLASELITCQRSSPQSPVDPEELYNDDECVTEQLFQNLTELDASSTWELTSILRPPKSPPREVRLIEATVLFWYARQDRLEVGNPISSSELRGEADDGCSTQTHVSHELEGYEVLPNSRPQGAVQDPRRLVFLRQGPSGDAYFALQSADEPICTDSEFPTPSDEITRDVGQKELRLEYAAWLSTP